MGAELSFSDDMGTRLKKKGEQEEEKAEGMVGKREIERYSKDAAVRRHFGFGRSLKCPIVV